MGTLGLLVVFTARGERDAGSFDDASDGRDRLLDRYLTAVDQLVVGKDLRKYLPSDILEEVVSRVAYLVRYHIVEISVAHRISDIIARDCLGSIVSSGEVDDLSIAQHLLLGESSYIGVEVRIDYPNGCFHGNEKLTFG